MENFDPLFEQSVAEYLFNLNKLRRRRYNEGDVVKEIFEYYFKHGRDCTQESTENIMNMFNAMMEKNRRRFETSEV